MEWDAYINMEMLVFVSFFSRGCLEMQKGQKIFYLCLRKFIEIFAGIFCVIYENLWLRPSFKMTIYCLAYTYRSGNGLLCALMQATKNPNVF